MLGIKDEDKVGGRGGVWQVLALSTRAAPARRQHFCCHRQQQHPRCHLLLCTQASQPAHFVAAYLQSAGVTVVPVPVFYPDATHMLGQPVYRRVQDVPGGPQATTACLTHRKQPLPASLSTAAAAATSTGTWQPPAERGWC